MAIDITKEQLITLTEATKRLPRLDGKRPSTTTLWRWCKKGLRGIRLEYVWIGGRICVSHEALNRFANRLAEADELPAPEPRLTPRAPKPRTASERAIQEARAALSKN